MSDIVIDSENITAVQTPKIPTIVLDKINKIKTQSPKIPLCAYLYDLDGLNKHTRAIYQKLPQNAEIFYATKANAEEAILTTIEKNCDGFEVASLGELTKIRQLFPQKNIVFGGPGKTDAELEACFDHHVQYIHVESLFELQRLAHISQQRQQTINILFRLNITFDALKHTRLMMGGKATPFGMDEKMLNACLCFLKNAPFIQLQGLHLHLVSFQIDEDAHIELIKQYIDYLHQFNKKHYLQLKHLNVGGGIGVNYQDPTHVFNWSYFFQNLDQILNQSCNQDIVLRFECGRSLTAYCGYYAAEVLDIKQSHDTYFAVVRGGTHHFRTPYAQSHSHPFSIINIDHWPHTYPRNTIYHQTCHIVGQLCTPKDILAYNTPIQKLSHGDIIVFSHAGAYAWNISHHDFLCHPHPDHYFLKEDITYAN
ncbi:type III PLP-dependent enzyme [Facilibium subflavum]|uniref:type III PLP-dependent enzyme n=1 Tax=Facilibium subflavum TaxID=2219058 RepID=UPI000E655C6B|nr:type III PLP-dependent enzyme [Facilibium subflavum]